MISRLMPTSETWRLKQANQRQSGTRLFRLLMEKIQLRVSFWLLWGVWEPLYHFRVSKCDSFGVSKVGPQETPKRCQILSTPQRSQISSLRVSFWWGVSWEATFWSLFRCHFENSVVWISKAIVKRYANNNLFMLLFLCFLGLC